MVRTKNKVELYLEEVQQVIEPSPHIRIDPELKAFMDRGKTRAQRMKELVVDTLYTVLLSRPGRVLVLFVTYIIWFTLLGAAAVFFVEWLFKI